MKQLALEEKNNDAHKNKVLYVQEQTRAQKTKMVFLKIILFLENPEDILNVLCLNRDFVECREEIIKSILYSVNF